MRTTWTFHSAGKLIFGDDAVLALGDSVRAMKIDKALIVTDRILVKVGILEAVQKSLAAAGVACLVFDGGEPEPSITVAEQCQALAKPFAPDAIIGLGGGSNMDLAKIVATVLTHGGGPRDYMGDCVVPGPVMPLICIPTTSGTGSEVTAAAVLTDHAQQMKISTLSNYLRPALAVVDPKLTYSCPEKVTADSGIDALTHAIEAYTAIDNEIFPLPPGVPSVYQGRHPLGDCFAEKAIELVGKFLVRAVRDGKDAEARSGMSLAATLAGLAFSNVGVAVVHALEYPVGGATHCSHGEGNGLLLPHVMRFNLASRLPQFAKIARLLGCDTTGMSDPRAAEAAVAAVVKLQVDSRIPTRLRDLGAREDQLPTFAEKAFALKRILRVNPREVTQSDLEAIYRAAY